MTAATLPRRVTPTAVRVLSADADRADWLTARREGIGSSDVAAILGLIEKRTPRHVYHDKRGELPPEEPNDPMIFGSLFEDDIAREWARRNRSVIQRVGLVAHIDAPWRLTTLDRMVLECPLDRTVRQRCALEVKCRNAFTRNRWRSDMPDDVLAQTTWQIDVTGYDHIHVAVVIGGNEYHQTVTRRDAQVAGYVRREVQMFREDYLLAGVPPPVDPDKASAHNELDALMHPDRVGEVDLVDVGDVIEYGELSARKGAAERALKRARARLAELADGARYVKFGDELAYEFSPVTKATADLERLAERWPDAYADCVTDKTFYQVRLAPGFRQRGEE